MIAWHTDSYDAVSEHNVRVRVRALVRGPRKSENNKNYALPWELGIIAVTRGIYHLRMEPGKKTLLAKLAILY